MRVLWVSCLLAASVAFVSLPSAASTTDPVPSPTSCVAAPGEACAFYCVSGSRVYAEVAGAGHVAGGAWCPADGARASCGAFSGACRALSRPVAGTSVGQGLDVPAVVTGWCWVSIGESAACGLVLGSPVAVPPPPVPPVEDLPRISMPS